MPVLGLVFGIDKLMDGDMSTLVGSETDKDVDPRLTESDVGCMPVFRLLLGSDADVAADGRSVESPVVLPVLGIGAEAEMEGMLLTTDPEVGVVEPGGVAGNESMITDSGRDTE